MTGALVSGIALVLSGLLLSWVGRRLWAEREPNGWPVAILVVAGVWLFAGGAALGLWAE